MVHAATARAGGGLYSYVSGRVTVSRDRLGQFGVVALLGPPGLSALEAAIAWTVGTWLAWKTGQEISKALKQENNQDGAKGGDKGKSAKDGDGAKSDAELEKHLRKRNDAKERLKDRERELDKARWPNTRRRLKRDIDDIKKDIEGHEKELRQKWPGCIL